MKYEVRSLAYQLFDAAGSVGANRTESKSNELIAIYATIVRKLKGE